MIYVRFSVILLLFFTLIGCNAVKKMNTSDEYKHSDNHDKVLSLPKEAQSLKINDNYPVPKITRADAAVESAHVLILPPRV